MLERDISDDSISIVVLTVDRCDLLRQCVENVLSRASPLTREIVIWNNGSRDGTAEYLARLDDSRIRVIQSDRNFGVNAYARAFASAAGNYLIELDDDVIDAPPHWDARLLESFKRLNDFGYLAASLVHDDHDVQAHLMYDVRRDLYRIEESNGVRIKVGGPVGGWCALTSREIYDHVGGWRRRRGAYWFEDEAYVETLARMNLRAGYVDDLRVRHAGGPYYAPTPPEKLRYFRAYKRRRSRKNALKRLLLAIPFVRASNERRRWFEPPRPNPDYVDLYSHARTRISCASSGSGSRQ